MKTIFRFVGFGVLLAAFIAVGNVAGFAQDPCADADGLTAMDVKFRELFAKTGDLDSRKLAIETGRQFLEKYGSCETAKLLSDYLKDGLPKIEENYKKAVIAKEKAILTARFDAGLRSKNWDEVYAAGKELLSKHPDEFRAAELVLGSIGLVETADKSPRVTKWNDDTLRYAKQSIQDLEANKPFKTYGLSIKGVVNFEYKDKDDALGWMNYTIGYILFFDKNNKKEAISYLYKASQLNSETKSNPVLYQSIGAYYFDDVKRLVDEVKVLISKQDPKDTDAVIQQKVDEIKAKVGILNGTTERALDAYGRAHKLIDPADKSKAAYRGNIHKTMEDLYKVRFAKIDDLDAWVAVAVTKPLPDPKSTIIPINDPEPVAPITTTTTTNTTPGTIKPPTTTPTKPPTTTPAKAPVSTRQPATAKAVVKKPVVKKRGA